MTQPLDPALQMGAVHLKVSLLDRSIAFYREVVGLEVLRQTAGVAELAAERGKEPLVVLEELPDAEVLPRRRTAGLYHYAILVPDRKALGQALRRLVDAGIHIGQSDHWVSEALYIADPDNNGIEIYCDRPRETWQWKDGLVQMGRDPIDWEGLLGLAGSEPAPLMPEGTKMGHVHLHVSEIGPAKRFYTEVIGLDVVAAIEDHAVFMSVGGYHHHLAINMWAGVGAPPAPERAAGLRYYTFALPDREAVDAVLGRLQAAGLPLEERDGAWLVQDPSRNTLRLVTA